MRWILTGAVFVGIAARSPRVRADDAELPSLASPAALVLDARTGAELFGKGADDVRPIASTTKIFVAMAVRAKGVALDAYTEILRDDVNAPPG
jgi:D-alanyl-D-alanine carboxypeptidase